MLLFVGKYFPPTPDQIYEAIKAVDTGRGVFLIIKNYSGNVMNFEMAKDMTELDEIEQLAQNVNAHLKTLGVALSAATVPEVGKPGFTLADDEIEYGVGIHSEPGYRREKLRPAKELVAEMLGKLADELSLTPIKKYAILVNGLGATPLMEQYIFCNDVFKQLQEKKITPVFSKVGNYMTSLEMAGISLTILELADEKWLDYLNHPVDTIAW